MKNKIKACEWCGNKKIQWGITHLGWTIRYDLHCSHCEYTTKSYSKPINALKEWHTHGRD